MILYIELVLAIICSISININEIKSVKLFYISINNNLSLKRSESYISNEMKKIIINYFNRIERKKNKNLFNQRRYIHMFFFLFYFILLLNPHTFLNYLLF
jgi:CRISPR/Cas system-associated protein Cas5 (RAMP superfamily)